MISEGLGYTLIDNSYYEVSGIGTCTDTDIYIPAEYNGLPVKRIGYRAFYNYDSLTSINIPDSVTSIGYNAFYGCSRLTCVYITDLAKWCQISFSSNPLSYAHNLYLNGTLVTELVIPNGVTSISGAAFSCCSSLTSISIPDSVTSIGYSAFERCSNLTNITFTGTQAQWDSISKEANWNYMCPATVVCTG